MVVGKLMGAALLAASALYTAGFWMTLIHILFDHQNATSPWEWAIAVIMSFAGSLVWPIYWPICH